MLCAWVVARADEGLGYTFGAAKIAAMFLINMPIQQAFIVMRNLLERHCLRSFFGGSGAKEDVSVVFLELSKVEICALTIDRLKLITGKNVIVIEQSERVEEY